MANVHMKLRGRAAYARDNPTAGVVIIDDTVKHVLIVVGVYAVLVIEMARLAVSEVIIRMRSGEAQRREKGRKNVKDYKHRRIKYQLQQDARPNQVYLEGEFQALKFRNFCRFSLTLDLRLYLVILTNGTKANVNPIPKTIPPMRPAKFCCHGNVLIPNKQAPINKSFIKAR